MEMIDSMTEREREHYRMIGGSRLRRFARGSGTTVQDVNRLLKQFVEMRRMLRKFGMVSQSKKRIAGDRRLPAYSSLTVR